MHGNPFSPGEIESRLARVRAELAARGLEAAVFAAPESVFWLTGLDHWGYVAPHLLILPVEGTPVLVTRAMERVTVERYVTAAEFAGHPDSETAADMAARVLAAGSAVGRPIGLEMWTAGLGHGLARRLTGAVDAEWRDVSGLVDALRRVKSAEEQVLMRRAAAVSRAGEAAALAALADGAREADVAAACCAAMIRAGGDPPGFGPFIRPAARIGEEHATWGEGSFRGGEPAFLELSGCVGRYHAPLGRLVPIGDPDAADAAMAVIAARAFDAVVAALRPGVKAGEVYAAGQSVVDDAGLAHYRRHHCGYLVGVGVPPSWTGGNTVTGLSPDSHLAIEAGMTFHVLSWLMGTGCGDAFVSDTVLVTEDETTVLTAPD